MSFIKYSRHQEKGEMFAKMAKHLNGLAFEVEKTMATNGVNVIPAAHHAVAAATNVTAPPSHPPSPNISMVVGYCCSDRCRGSVLDE